MEKMRKLKIKATQFVHANTNLNDTILIVYKIPAFQDVKRSVSRSKIKTDL